ncbi:hypothetical protein wTpre_681 [Wolbachia endosymbiont of Trichogramma pretiosum]|nr:hypothetical protein wTpre_681 [Wolbachia endosymbiont of Trichogramma pretiosum]
MDLISILTLVGYNGVFCSSGLSLGVGKGQSIMVFGLFI